MAEGLYPKEAGDVIEAVLSRSEQPMILDIGCGSGSWYESSVPITMIIA